MSSTDDILPVLGIETSCDETAAAVVVRGAQVLSSIVSSQIDLHAVYGGVVPELASRAHLEIIGPVVTAALEQAGLDSRSPAIECIAATVGPGLIGSLLVGVSSAKAMALAWDIPFVGVNHLEAHLYAAFLAGQQLEFPMLVLLVSGGHTMLIRMAGHGNYELLGQTVDDAAGEAFDKVARFLDLGYPGGPAIDRAAAIGNPGTVRFPRPLIGDGYDFSFSGLKTSVIRWVKANPDCSSSDVAAAFQEAAVDVLVAKSIRAAKNTGVASICLAGGVAANSALRARMADECNRNGLGIFVPPISLCTDNAAMVAAAGWWRFSSDGPTGLDKGAIPSLGFPSGTLDNLFPT
ncbi:MAG TPA: tRNA (adenosine(37)-N6)-threonylcarbamoyltransferase complex transferase subunit TsaD [Acidimicrobiales bacterium]|nr:tRNA (adenosine(37)-N6)-threonylcarbamoyltransferase complex transferase subunit TsaD [Acidimicrobiales bacterium]